jgi:hypothetical protein
MAKYGEILEDFYSERTRILGALQDEPYENIIMRLIGALAFRTKCPRYGYLQDELGRVFTDIDFASYPRFSRKIRQMLGELGYEEDKQVTQLFGDRRMLFHDPVFGRHIDVFYDVLDFCHPIHFSGRLEVEPLTLPLAELLLEKMQIVKINEKDQIDTMMLLREYPIGDHDHELINATLITKTLSNDWGFWRTVSGNLELLPEAMQRYDRLSVEDRQVIGQRIKELQDRIDASPKSLRWKARARIGEKVKWYKDVEELMR